MKINCPNCGADYRISESKIPLGGLQIKCPSCLHSFVAMQDGGTRAVSIAPSEVSSNLSGPPKPPGPPPPPGGVDMPPPPPESVGFGSDSTLVGSQPPGQVADQFESFDFGPGGSASAPPVPPAPVQESDFDFSFGEASAAPPPAPPPAQGESGLDDLFEDLEDLPAPKAGHKAVDFGDLPAPRQATEDLPQAKAPIRDLPQPSLPPAASQLREEPKVELPITDTGGLIAPEAADDLPELPDDAQAHQFASTGQTPMFATTIEEPETDKKKIFLIAGAVASIFIGLFVVLFTFELGPFAPDYTAQTKPRRLSAPKTLNAQPPSAPVVLEEGEGLMQAAGPTLAEISGIRGLIGELETKKEPTEADRIKLIQSYAMGALEYPENERWVTKAKELNETLSDDMKKNPAAKLAGLAVSLSSGEAKVSDLESFSKAHPKFAMAQYFLGHARVQNGDFQGAVKAFKNAVKGDSKLLNAARMVGELQTRLGYLDAAETTFDNLYRKAPGAPGVNIGLAAVEFRKGNLDRAKRLLTQIFVLEKGRARPRDRSAGFLLRARLTSQMGNEKEALTDLDSAVRSWPGNLEALDLLGSKYFKTGAFEKALEVFQTLSRSGYRSPQLSIKIAECFSRMNRPDRAIEQLRDSLGKFPEAAELQGALGDIYVGARDFTEARKAYEQAIEMDPGHENARLKIAEMLIQESKVDAALDYLSESIEANPKGARLYQGLANLKRRMGETSSQNTLLMEAKDTYLKALALDPSLLDARKSLVGVLISIGDAKTALKELEHLQSRADFHGSMDYELGRTKQALGKLDVALSHYEKAISEEPENPDFLMHAGSAWFEKQKLEKAKALFTKATKIAPKRVVPHYYLGRISLQQDDSARAIQSFRQAIELEKRNYENRYWLARALEAAGNEAQLKAARQEYDTVVEQVTKDVKLKKVLCDVFIRRAKMEMLAIAQWQAAIDDLTEYTDCEPKNAEAYFLRGGLHEKMGALDKAIKDFGKATKLNPKLGEAYAANAYAKLRKPNSNEREVQSLLQKAISATPTLAMPHYTLCTMLKERSTQMAGRHCKDYLKKAPNGEYASEVKELLRNL